MSCDERENGTFDKLQTEFMWRTGEVEMCTGSQDYTV